MLIGMVYRVYWLHAHTHITLSCLKKTLQPGWNNMYTHTYETLCHNWNHRWIHTRIRIDISSIYAFYFLNFTLHVHMQACTQHNAIQCMLARIWTYVCMYEYVRMHICMLLKCCLKSMDNVDRMLTYILYFFGGSGGANTKQAAFPPP
jgi:hypothetical protein